MKFPKLLDCPFCGEIPTLSEDRNTEPSTWKVVCTFCGASIGDGLAFPYTSAEEAAMSWNRRGGVFISQEDIK